MLDEVRPDVLHVTTPPQTHAAVARQALAAGAHVYVEKPFTLDAAEAEEVLAAAEAAGRLVCLGHDQLFDPVWQECRQACARGELGRVLHIDSVMGYDLGGPFGRVLATDPTHWVHRLPGGLFQNTISHALYKVTDFLGGDRPRVWATWFADPEGPPFPTDLRVMLRGDDGVTGNLTFLSAARPKCRVVRLYGTRQWLEVDFEGRLLRRRRPPALPSALAKLEFPLRHLGEAARNLVRNLGRFLRNDLHYFTGMRRLFGLFYQAVRDGGEPPIPYREVRRVTALMDEIFRQCRAAAGPREEPPPAARNGHAAARRVVNCLS
jgi:predicted dehydrogenase